MSTIEQHTAKERSGYRDDLRDDDKNQQNQQDQRERSQQDRRRDEEQSGREMAERRDDARQQLDRAGDSGRQATSSYVRALNDTFQAMVPRGFMRPGEMIRTWFELAFQGLDLSRQFWGAVVEAAQDQARTASREADRDDRVAR